MSKVIGIDLGTTNSCVAILESGNGKVLENSEGNRTTPSVVSLREGDRLVGQIAKRQAITNPRSTISSIKRFMGRKYTELTDSDKSQVPYELTNDKNDNTVIKIDDKTYTPQEISAMILQKAKETAEDYLGEKVTQAIITVPAYFDDSQRKATEQAGEIAGLEVLRIINEPTAASLAYGIEDKESKKIAVYDLGGGTFDISILELGDGVFEVKSTNGDTHLGGDDFDQVIINWIQEEFLASDGIDLSKDDQALQRLKDAAETAKCELSSNTKADINLPFITMDDNGPKHLTLALTRSKFEQLSDSLIDKTLVPCKQALTDSGFKIEDIDEVVLVGGQTRMPKVQEKVSELFKKEPHKGVNPDEVVAIGAAIQGGILAGDSEVKDMVLLDVTPLSLGIETLGGIFTKLIEKNSTIPTTKQEIFSTAENNQPAVDVHVLQGEREMASYNKTIGRFRLDNIPPALRGVPQIEVKFNINANGILEVSAKDLGTNKEQSITITASSGLSSEEIEQMVKDAEENAEADKQKREEAEVRNGADSLVYQTEKQLEELEEKIDETDKEKIQPTVDKVKEALGGDDIEAVKEAVEALNKSWHEISAKIYENIEQEAADGVEVESATEEPPQEGEVVDVDYEVVDNEEEQVAGETEETVEANLEEDESEEKAG